MIITVLRPILFSFLTSKQVKQLIVDVLEALDKKAENTLDEQAVVSVRRALLHE